MEIIIDLMTEEDLPGVMEIENQSFPSPWSIKTFLYELRNNPYSLYLTAYKATKPLGYVGGWLLKDRLHITNLAVARDFRYQGIAIALINEIIRISQLKGVIIVTLEVRTSNKAAIRLYKKMGFYEKDYFTGYYANNNEDALLMRKELNNETKYD